jgi:hypothetical protein
MSGLVVVFIIAGLGLVVLGGVIWVKSGQDNIEKRIEAFCRRN